jgi:hypothetical protein
MDESVTDSGGACIKDTLWNRKYLKTKLINFPAKKLLGRHSRSWEDNIKTHLMGAVCDIKGLYCLCN